jgi:hypothetical protein
MRQFISIIIEVKLNTQMSALNISVLAQGREFYLRQLKLHLTPLIYEGLVSLYEDAKKREEQTNEFEGNSLKQFQKLLCDIPSWNQSILEEETRRILTECDFLMEMVAAVFVAHVQILASVKLGGKNSKIRVKIPTSDIFIHAVYSKSAETFYYNPYKFETYHVRESNEYIREMINRNIDDVIDSMIPIESIIKEYISNVFTSHTKDNPRAIETLEPEAPGTTLDHNDLGLYDNAHDNHEDHHFGKTDSFDTPANDDFGAGKGDHFSKTLGIGEGGDDFADDLDIGKDPVDSEPSKFDFKDDETDIFSNSKHVVKESSPFKDVLDDIGGGNEDPVFKPTGGTDEDPFKSIGGDEDPFKSTGGGEDPFKSTGEADPFKSSGGADEDPFKNDLGIGAGLDEIPNPPELEKDGIFSQKQDEINFFDELP